MIVRQSTAFETSIGPVLDADGVAFTGAIVGDFQIKKNGADWAALDGSATATHTAVGNYDLVLTTSDLDTVGIAAIRINDTVNACATIFLQVIEEAAYDALFAASAVGPLLASSNGSGLTEAGGDGDHLTALATQTSVNTIDDLLDTEIGALTTELAKVPKSDGTASWNATALAAIEQQATDALNAYDPPTHVELQTALTDMEAALIAAIPGAVWDQDATGHQTQGTFGQAIGDPVADTNTIFKAVVTDATGATVGADSTAILADTNELQGDWANGGRLDVILDARASQSSVDTIDDLLDTEIASLQTTLNALFTTALSESYRSAGAAPTMAQFAFETLAHLGDASISSTTKTLRNLAGTAAKTFTLDSATTPTSITEAT